ncbi:histidinol-phosphate transaminase [candidate division KSB1 bacterium]
MIKPKKTVRTMRVYDPPTSSRKGKLRLDFNENTVGCSPKVIEAIKNVSAEDISIYPEYSYFRNKLADYLKLKSDEVILTNGADEAINVVMNTYLNKGDEIILPSPTFAMFEVIASVIGAEVKELLYKTDLSFPVDDVLKSISRKTRMVILVNPNNPTGSSINGTDIIRIAEKAKKAGAVLLIDEAYYQFYGKSAKKLIRKYSNIVVMQTFSKAFGLAGMRLGYIISRKENIAEIGKVLSPYSVNTLAVIAGNAALDDQDFVEGYVNEVKEAKKYLEKQLKKMGIKIFPSDTNFLIAKFGDRCNLVCNALKDKGILVRNRSKYPRLEGCVRIGVGTKEQCKILVNEIKSIIDKKILLFDMDGVLADVSQSYRIAAKKTVEFFTKQKISPEEIQLLKEEGGFNNDWVLTKELILRKGKSIGFNAVKAKFQEFYLGNSWDGLILREDLLLSRENLEELKKSNRLGIITGRPRQEAEFFLNKNKIRDLFEIVICKEDVEGKEKPDPYGLILALKKMKVPGSCSVYYLGDSVDDMIAAKKAGITPIGVVPPGVPDNMLRSLLEKKGAKFVLDDINNIMEAIK